jgi:hypothetical protein
MDVMPSKSAVVFSMARSMQRVFFRAPGVAPSAQSAQQLSQKASWNWLSVLTRRQAMQARSESRESGRAA